MEDILQSAASNQLGVVAAENGGVCSISRRALRMSERLSRAPCEWWGDLTVPQVLASPSWFKALAWSLIASSPPPPHSSQAPSQPSYWPWEAPGCPQASCRGGRITNRQSCPLSGGGNVGDSGNSGFSQPQCPVLWAGAAENGGDTSLKDSLAAPLLEQPP